jgi:hypothetical protein
MKWPSLLMGLVEEAYMALTRRAISTLLDLVEIKLGYLEVMDREDQRELKLLRACRSELLQLMERQRALAPALRQLASESVGVPSAAMI